MPKCAVEYLPSIKFGKYISVEMTWGVKTARWETLAPKFYPAKTYMLWIHVSSLTAFNLQNLVHRASPAILACSWYSTAIQSKKDREKSRGYGSFTVLYCVILYCL